MKPKKEIKDFIGVFDNYITPAACEKMITYFKNQNAMGKAFNRQSSEGVPLGKKKDLSLGLNANNVHAWVGQFTDFFVNVERALVEYDQETGFCEACDTTLHYTSFRVQRTLPGEGYHVWHTEHTALDDQIARLLVFSVYLNNVEEGGETEFLHQKQRVQPKTGRIVIWPAGFPYLHRGNPPLSGEKYILTSWMRSGCMGFKNF
ncbi:MAG: 2OG-Fe(II) oxygenase [Gammaproteobacteria bacterium]